MDTKGYKLLFTRGMDSHNSRFKLTVLFDSVDVPDKTSFDVTFTDLLDVVSDHLDGRLVGVSLEKEIQANASKNR